MNWSSEDVARRIVQAVADQLWLEAEGPTESRINKLIALSVDALRIPPNDVSWNMTLVHVDPDNIERVLRNPTVRLTVVVAASSASALLERVNLQAMAEARTRELKAELKAELNAADAVFGEEGR